MSLGSQLLKSGIAVALFAGIGWSLESYYNARVDNQTNRSELKSVKSQYRVELTKKPTTKTVTTNYQKAVNAANKYLKYANALHDSGSNSSKDGKLNLAKMKNMVSDPSSITGPLVAYQIKDWHGVVSYGGQNSEGKIVMSYKFFNKSNKLMKLYTFYYNPDSGVLSGFSYYFSKAGRDQLQQTLGG